MEKGCLGEGGGIGSSGACIINVGTSESKNKSLGLGVPLKFW